jgi:uncharacterized protein YndB with AHSA1/START domain
MTSTSPVKSSSGNPPPLSVTTPSDREIVITRVFNAPRQLVYEAHTKPELLKRWLLGPPGWEMTDCEVAKKSGEPFRYVWRHSDGSTLTIHGVVRELSAERIVHTEQMSDIPGESLVTTVFSEHGGKTTVTLTCLYGSRETRDAMLKSGMEHGLEASYQHLDALLTSKAA